MDSKTNLCVLCHHARMKKDICGIYCAGEFWKNPDGSCGHFLDHEDQKKRKKRAKRR